MAPSEDRTGLQRAPESNLLQTEAEARKRAIGDVHYELSIDLDDRTDEFKGVDRITFTLLEPAKDLFLDFKSGGRIDDVKINGKSASASYSQHRIALPELTAGTNTVEISYRQSYSHEGRGLHRFVDPEDGQVYLYTQFEAFDAHQMFPCFDQPDLKATMQLTVTAPNTWEVISTTRETERSVQAERTHWMFAETPKISTYLFSLHAGPYTKWESLAGTIPLRLFARQSMAKYIVTDDWFIPTRQGLGFYGGYFDFPYPFKKYDQVIVPEFNAGAMENVAAVTFSERFVHRGPTTRKERENLASVILHEMGHMWFGDLVTMQWWNGTWLNESFATFASEFAMQNATEFADYGASFNSGSKASAYIQDQLVTTHAIDYDVPDTNSAFANFDAITYGKGASVLKELHFLIGDEAFRDGLRLYFKKHAYNNTRLEDFIGALESTSHRDLQKWAKAWLETAGLDTIRADYSCREGRVSRFDIKLDPPALEARQRIHAGLVTLMENQKNQLVPIKTSRVEYGAETTGVPSFLGRKCPDFVFLNDQDHDYVKTQLDDHSLAQAKDGVYQFETPLARTMVWQSLYGMVRDVKLKPSEFLNLVAKDLPREEDYTTGEQVIRNLPNVIYYLPQSTPAERDEYMHQIHSVEEMLWKRAQASEPGSDWQRLALSKFGEIAQTNVGCDRLLALLTGQIRPKGYVMDMDQRWSFIIHLASQGDQRVLPILEEQRRLDASDRGVQNAFAAEASMPAIETKMSWLSRTKEKRDLSFTQKRQVLMNVLPPWQDDLREKLGPAFYEDLPKLVKTHDLQFSGLYSKSLLPTTCSNASVQALDEFLKTHAGQMPVPVLKTLRSGADEDRRCVAIRNFGKSG